MRKLKINILLLALVLTSCGANYHLKRAVAKDPTILKTETIKLDTIVVTETKTLEAAVEFKTDTIIKVEQRGIQTEIKILTDTILIETICPPDTITISEQVEVERLIFKEKKTTFDKVKSLLLILTSLFLLASLTRLIKK